MIYVTDSKRDYMSAAPGQCGQIHALDYHFKASHGSHICTFLGCDEIWASKYTVRCYDHLSFVQPV